MIILLALALALLLALVVVAVVVPVNYTAVEEKKGLDHRRDETVRMTTYSSRFSRYFSVFPRHDDGL